MKVLFCTFVIISGCVATNYLSTDGLTNLFIRAGKNNLNHSDWGTIHDLAEILYLPQDEFVNDETRLAGRSNLFCVLCRSVFSAFIDLVNAGVNDEDLVDSIVLICNTLSIVSPKVCHGAVLLNVPILSYIVRNTPEAEASTFCGVFFQTAIETENCRYNDERFNWKVELPPIGEISKISYDNRKPLTVAIITDAHIDPLYEENGVADCSEPTCCRKGQTPRNHKYTYNPDRDESIILKSLNIVNGEPIIDVGVAKTLREVRNVTRRSERFEPPAGYWGDYRNCDSPIRAYDDVVDRIHSSHKDVDLIYYMGDTIDHHVWETTYELIDEVNLYLVNKLRKTFGDVPVIATIGNHESQPTNQFAPERITQEKLNTTWLYESLARKWGIYLTEEAKTTLRRRGDFSMVVRPGLRVISLNTNIAYKNNWWLVFDPLDAKTHLDWLVSELYKAEKAGEKVHILTHIPPGVHDLVNPWTREYNRIVNRFQQTIAAEFNGHTHTDEFKIFYSIEDKDIPIAVSWGGGSASAYSNNNVNYKIAVLDPNNYNPISISNYVYNLTEANLTPNRRPHWFKLYDFKNTYGVKDLSPNSMNELVYSMVTDKKYLLDIYSAFYSKLSDTRWANCSNDCKIANLCRIVVTVLFDRKKCEELTKLYNSRK
ncbi:sphingomyelin phosphodiesterase 1-like [Pieris napi]|uniref:sphingomyelin phosphodiesterase 1-like n=1 Tax=Pieris napi TaxID=78633 RepID=UPI001FBBC70C|nr:sphingomyelin phosphodiesterase 1-like [Pieris napi]